MKKIISLAIAVLTTAIASQASELNVYPIPAVFTSKNVNDSAFQKVLSKHRGDFVKAYITQFDKYFPNANKEISDKTKYKTFASYVHVPRASQYRVQKSERLLDFYLPLTMSINFVNMATGETLYSYPVTNYFKYETTVESDIEKRKEKIIDLTKQNYEQTLEEVVKQASIDFKPFDITAKVKDTYRHLYILDKGLESGITKGDLLTDENINQISVIYSDLNYSVAEKVLGKPSVNSNFSKFANSNITQLKKPKILFINDFGNEKLYNLFATALGSSAEFSLMTTDKTYYDMQTALVSLNMDFKSANTYNRTMPDYFLKLYFTPPAYAQFKSKKDYFNVDKYSMLACGVIFDKAGRVVYSQCSDDEMINKVVGDVRFNDEANTEIIAKNLLGKLATSMQKEIQFKDVKFKIQKTDNQYLTLADPNGFLKEGNVLTIFKKIKTEKSGQEILIPTWDYRVIVTDNGIAECKMSKPYVDGIDFPSKRDIVQMTAMTRSANKANMFNYYPDKVEVDGNEVKLPAFERIAFGALASSVKAPIAMHPADFQEQIDELNTLGFKDKITIPENDANLSIKAVYKVNMKSEEAKGSVLKQQYDIIVGIVSKKGEEIIKKDGLMQTITITVPQEDNKQIIENELMKHIYPLIQQVGMKF